MKPQLLLLSTCFLLVLAACQKDNNTYIYQVNDVVVTPNNADKDKEKTSDQYVNILYANLYQKALSPNQLVDLTDVIASIGDKQIAYETITAKMMADSEVLTLLPTTPEMRADVERFVVETYQRFFVRLPTEAEKVFFVNFIETHPNLTPEHVYFTFATCNEYNYY